MELETANTIFTGEATEADIEKTFKDDLCRGKFAILTKEDGSFLQAAGGMQGPFMVEYCDADKQYMATRELSKSETKEVFMDYLRNGNEWKASYEWKEIEQKSGCAGKTGILLLLISSGITAVFSIT